MTSGRAEHEHLMYTDQYRYWVRTGKWPNDPEEARAANAAAAELAKEDSGSGLTPGQESGREQGGAPPTAAGSSAAPGAPRRPTDPPTAARPARPPGQGPSGAPGSA